MTPVPEKLVQSVRERRAILFVGAGVSMSVGLPSWQTLIDHMAEELGLDPSDKSTRTATYQTLAEYYRLSRGSIGPIRSWMDREWRVSEEKVRDSGVHDLIVSLDFPIIYTTNYDRNLETAFEIHGKPFVKIANARDLAYVAEDATQIVKFHGDFDDDESLVLAETDYFARLAFDSPLDVKFRADAMGRTVLYIGYSLTDLNIRLLLHRMWQTWRASGYDRDRPPSFAFMSRSNSIQSAVLGSWGIELLSGDTEEPNDALAEFLSALKKRVDAASADAQDQSSM